MEAVGPHPNASNLLKCLISPEMLKFFSWPKFDEGYWNYHVIPVLSRAVSILPPGAKGMAK